MPGIKFQRELVTKNLCEELIPLLVAHFSETAHFQEFNFHPNYARYIDLELNGALRAFTVRDRNKLVGYNVFFVSHNMHQSNSIQACQDILYISPEHRGVGKEFVVWCDNELALDDIDIVYQNVPVENDYGARLLTPLGYKKIETVYAKRCGL